MGGGGGLGVVGGEAVGGGGEFGFFEGDGARGAGDVFEIGEKRI